MKNFIFCCFLCALAACTNRSGSGSAVSPVLTSAMTGEQLQERGKVIYVTNCLACHNADSSKDGSLGPALKGASLELLTAKLLKSSYPEGYARKRPTALMPALPHLEKELPALHAYLN